MRIKEGYISSYSLLRAVGNLVLEENRCGKLLCTNENFDVVPEFLFLILRGDVRVRRQNAAIDLAVLGVEAKLKCPFPESRSHMLALSNSGN
jgi:hypothetical protein